MKEAKTLELHFMIKTETKLNKNAKLNLNDMEKILIEKLLKGSV